MKRIGAPVLSLALVFLLLAACEERSAPDPRRTANPDKYSRDRELCRTQVDEYMRTRRNVDDSRRDVFSGEQDRMGRGGLTSQMDNYGDTRSFDKMMGSCMEARGWSQPKQQWWQKFGTGTTL